MNDSQDLYKNSATQSSDAQSEAHSSADASQGGMTNSALQECQQQVQQWKDKYIQLQADMQNLQRRMVREQTLWVAQAQSRMFNNLLTIVDDFDRAVEHLTEDSKQACSGFLLIHQAFQKFLTQEGVQEITQITEFDPNLHEALLQVPNSGKPAGTIIAVLRKGYTYQGNVLRVAQVSVAV